MAVIIASGSGNWSSATTWRGGVIPTSGDDVYSNAFSITVDQDIDIGSLNNNVTTRPIATPQMTSNTLPSGVAAASNITSSANDAWRAFDRAANSWATSGSIRTGWISYDFGIGNEKAINAYTLTGTATQNINPQSWSFQGSNDNINWDTLDTGTATGGIGSSAVVGNFSLPNSSSYRYYRVTASNSGVGINLGITEVTMYESSSVWGLTTVTTAGGGFTWSTGGYSASLSGATPLAYGAADLLTFSHGSGDVTMSLSNNTTSNAFNPRSILYSGNGNLVFSSPNIDITLTGGGQNYISKTGAGNLIINGNILLRSTMGTNAGTSNILNITNGNLEVNGNVIMINITTTTGNTIRQILQSSGDLIINGSISPSIAASPSVQTINFTGATLTINGQLLPGVGNNVSTTGITTINGNVNSPSTAAGFAYGILASNTLTINGDVYGNSGGNAAVYSTSANTINISGSIYGGNAYGVYSITNAAIINISGSVYAGTLPAVGCLVGTVNLTGGNMYNFRGANAIWSPGLTIDDTVTVWQLNQDPNTTKTLYVSGTFPNLPSSTDVRSGSAYGPDNTLVGSMDVPSPSDVRSGVAVDSTTGSAQLNAADIISAINASNDPLAIRLKSILTDKTAGSLMSQYNNV
jgi:hypothetical protein